MQENLNVVVAYVLIGAVGVFCLLIVAGAARTRVRALRSGLRHRRRPSLTLRSVAEPVSAQPEAPSVEVSDVDRLFGDFDRRFAQLADEIHALTSDRATRP